MPYPQGNAEDGYKVVFVKPWTDTTRHGRMQDYPVSDEPRHLSKRAADAAIASGCAILPAVDGGPADPDAASA